MTDYWVTTNGPAPDTVTVSVESRHGRTKLHTFASAHGDRRRWYVATPASQRQYGTAPSRLLSPRQIADRDARRELRRQARAEGTGWQPPLPITPPNTLGLDYGNYLSDRPVNLGEGVTPHGNTLAVVLDALRAHGRAEVDLGDLKVVLSQLGARITQLDALTDVEQRIAAEELVSDQIVARCTKL